MKNLITCLDRNSVARIFFWLLSIAAGMNAMDPSRAMSQYIRDRWGPEQGFPRGAVYAITQTSDGYLWIGTEAGLVRFDGWNFRMIDDSSRNLKIANVLGLAPASDGSLWVRMQGMTLLRYRNDLFESPASALPDASMTAMSRTSQGDLLIAVNEDGALAYRNGKFQVLASGADLPRSPVLALAQMPDGDLWMGTRDAGLFRASAGGASAVLKGLPDAKINCLLPSGSRDLWIGTDNGIVRWNGAELSSTGLPTGLNGFQALAMTRDRDGNLWVGTDSRGLLRLNSESVASLDEPREGPPQAVTAVFEDREGNLWTGGASGLERLRDSPFVSYSAPEGLPTDGSIPVFVDAENRMWFPPLQRRIVVGEEWTERTDCSSRIGKRRGLFHRRPSGRTLAWQGTRRIDAAPLPRKAPAPAYSARTLTLLRMGSLKTASIRCTKLATERFGREHSAVA